MDVQPDPITVVVAQRVKPGCEAEYETWISHIIEVSSTYPGHLGANVIRPQPGVRPEYVVVFRFDRYEHLKGWMTSRDREYWVEQAKPLVAADPQVQEISGIEAWFSLPGQLLKTPPRYKTALLTFAAVYVLINVLTRVLAPVLSRVPAWVASLMICSIMVLLLTYVVMPRISRLFSKWLYGGRDRP